MGKQRPLPTTSLSLAAARDPGRFTCPQCGERAVAAVTSHDATRGNVVKMRFACGCVEVRQVR